MEFSKSRARFRNWALGQEQAAGAWGRDEIRNIMGSASPFIMDGYEPSVSGTMSVKRIANAAQSGDSRPTFALNFNASNVVPTGPQNVPQHIWQPIILYLGCPR